MAKSENQHPVTSGRNRKVMACIVLVGIFVVFFGGRAIITGQIETRIQAKLRERGLDIGWSGLSWTPWQGIRMRDLAIHRIDGERSPVAELGNLAVRFPILQLPGGGKRPVVWTINDARVDLHDASGKVTLNDVSISAEALDGRILVTRGTAREDGLIADLTGEITTKPVSSKKPFQPDLSAVRGVLAALDFRTDGPFRVTGDFNIDRSGDKAAWTTNLKGSGGHLVWKEIPLENANAEATLSSAESTITVALKAPRGLAKGTITKAGRGDVPFLIEGTLESADGHADSFEGSYAKKRLTLGKLEGSANLWELAADIPALREALSDKVVIFEFPDISLKNLRADFSRTPTAWSIESIATKRPAAVAATMNGQEVRITGLTGSASLDDRNWKLKDVEGSALGGSFSLAGNYRDGRLSGSRIDFESIKLTDVKRLGTSGAKKASRGILHGNFRGDVDMKNRHLDGSGSARLEDAPVFEVPLLEPVFDLFAALIPGIDRSEDGQFDMTFTAQSRLVQVTRFEAKGGTLSVSATGTANLETRTVNGVARGNLTGIPGLLTSPLSRLLEMEVGGPFENIRVKPLGPAKLASNAASGTVGTAVDVLEEAGNITGDVLKKGVETPLRWLRREEAEKK